MDNNPIEGYWTCEDYEEDILFYHVDGPKAGYWSEYLNLKAFLPN